MGNPIFGGCPYQAEDGYNDRNRFPHGHLFVGEIENGKRYPFGVYTKEEADERFAVKQVESDLDTLGGIVATKANEEEVAELRARVDALEYQDIKITSIVAVPATCERGSSNAITVSWTTSKLATEQYINGTEVTGNGKQYTGVSTDTEYELTVSDGRTSATRSVSVSFANQIYYGAAADLSNVTNLTSVLSDDPERTITVDAGAGKYIVYAIPARLGDVLFFVGGFEGGFEEPDTLTLTNGSGYQEPYKVYRSTNANLGTTIVEIKEG